MEMQVFIVVFFFFLSTLQFLSGDCQLIFSQALIPGEGENREAGYQCSLFSVTKGPHPASHRTACSSSSSHGDLALPTAES